MLLTQLETKLGLRKRIGLEVLIEESEGLANAVEIARSSDRLEAIIFGAGDLSASQRARVDGNFDPVSEYPGDFWHFARFQVVTAARAAGIDAIDAPYPAYQDPDGYRRSAVHASLLGFDGKWAIHPGQIAIAHEVFSPTDGRGRGGPASPSRPTAGPRPRASAPSGATAGSWTPPTCAWPRTPCTRRRWPGRAGRRAMSDDQGPTRGRRRTPTTWAAAGLRFERDGVIGWCIIDRPAARNAFTPAMYFGLKRAVRLVNTDPDLAALIITGTGDVFAPGGDLGGREEPGDRLPDGLGHEILPFLAIRDSPAPVDRGRQRHLPGRRAAGGDDGRHRVASDRATFRVPELLRGIPDATYAAALPAHVGVAVARDLLLSARRFDAAEAQRLGVISRVVPHEDCGRRRSRRPSRSCRRRPRPACT